MYSAQLLPAEKKNPHFRGRSANAVGVKGRRADTVCMSKISLANICSVILNSYSLDNLKRWIEQFEFKFPLGIDPQKCRTQHREYNS